MENIPATGSLAARSRTISNRTTERRRAVNSGVTFDLTGESRAIDRSLRTIWRRAASIAGALSLYLKDSRTKVKKRERGGRSILETIASRYVSRDSTTVFDSRDIDDEDRARSRDGSWNRPMRGFPDSQLGKISKIVARAAKSSGSSETFATRLFQLREDLNRRVEQRGSFSEDSAGAERLRI